MRILGALFVISLLLAAFGYFRGWFAVSTTHAAGKANVTLEVDRDRFRDDARSAGAKLSRLSTKTVAAVQQVGQEVSPVESVLEGTVTAVDGSARELTLAAGAESIALHVPTTVPITRDGSIVEFAQLRANQRVKLTIEHAGVDRTLSRIAILH